MIRRALLGLIFVMACTDGIRTGEIDGASMHACSTYESYAGDGEPLAAAATEIAAAEIMVHPNQTYSVQLEGHGYVTLHVPEGHHDYAIFVDSGTKITSTELGIASPAKAGACDSSGLRDFRTHIHAEGTYVLHLDGSGSVFLHAMPIATMHTPDGGHDAGGDAAVHEHDAGAMDAAPAHDAAHH